MSLPSLPVRLTIGQKFPYPEGQSIELKQANLSKLADTLCGFLNTEGGYYIIGVADDGKVTGIDQKKLDGALCTVDNILRGTQIINTETKRSVTTAHIQCIIIPIDGTLVEKFVLAVRAEADNSSVWQRPHAIIRRLHASNWSIPTDRMPIESELNSLRARNTMLENNIRKCVIELKTQEAAATAAIKQIAATRTDCDTILKMLHDTILRAKEAKEKEMCAAATSGLFATICCGLF